MENQISFDLNLAIQSWRENLSQSSALRNENLNELESHLRDSVATLQTAGLSGEEAFVIASRRIGKAQQLETEFGKVNAKAVWLDRLLWMLIGIQAWTFAYSLIGTVTSSLLMLGWSATNYHWNQGLTLPLVLFAVVHLLSVGACVWFCWWLIFRKGGRFSGWLRDKFQQRSLFVGFCVAACLLSLSAQVLAPFISAYLRWRFGPAALGETAAYINYTKGVVYLAATVGMIIFTFLLARKRFRMKSA